MRKLFLLLSIITLLFTFACDKALPKNPSHSTEENYFPSVNSGTWAGLSPDSINLDEIALESLLNLLEEHDTRAFIILKGGKIVVEEYFGKNLPDILPFTKDTRWYWASVGKTLTGFAVGKAEEDGFLQLEDKTSDYLGAGWTSLTDEQEEKITILHQLSMITGLDDGVANSHSTTPENLIYKADPGDRWAYHNAPYTLLEQVVTNATAQNFDDYLQANLLDKIGMDGEWNWIGDDHVFFSTARSMARFGLLVLNNGIWENERILNQSYMEKMGMPSQNINNSYGYLWWLNGKESYMLPGSQFVFSGSMTPHGQDDMYSAVGKNGQYLCIVPSKDMVLLRMGKNPDEALVPVSFLDEIWALIP